MMMTTTTQDTVAGMRLVCTEAMLDRMQYHEENISAAVDEDAYVDTSDAVDVDDIDIPGAPPGWRHTCCF